jgi:sigma-B regulation protein RsbU (phosphoserine phosphatase)
VSSEPFAASAHGGDVHYLSVCDGGVLSRVALGDVSGHGQAVAAIAERLRRLMHQHINTWDQAVLVRDLNESFRKGLNGFEYATMVVLGFFPKTGETIFTSAGHPAPLRYRAEDDSWGWLEEADDDTSSDRTGLPIGLFRDTHYRQTELKLAPGDMLVLYTDAVTEATDARGRQIGASGLMGLTAGLPTGSAQDAGQALKGALDSHRDGAPPADDETLIILRRPAA